MKKKQYKPKQAAFRKANLNKVIKRGDEVVDLNGHKGIVVNTYIPEVLTTEEHGMVEVWQMDRYDYGSNNCEHYPYLNWQSILKIIS